MNIFGTFWGQKTKLENICVPKNDNKFFSYTEEIKSLDISKVILNKIFENRHQFFFENNKSNLSLIGLGASDIIEFGTCDLEKTIIQIRKKLNTIINISDNKNITAKFLGGYKFDFSSQIEMNWGEFPKGYFFLPEYIISYNNIYFL